MTTSQREPTRATYEELGTEPGRLQEEKRSRKRVGGPHSLKEDPQYGGELFAEGSESDDRILLELRQVFQEVVQQLAPQPVQEAVPQPVPQLAPQPVHEAVPQLAVPQVAVQQVVAPQRSFCEDTSCQDEDRCRCDDDPDTLMVHVTSMGMYGCQSCIRAAMGF